MTKTTFGDWKVVDDGADKTDPIEVRSGDLVIADVLRSGEWHSRDAEDAFARLIAAAPRLLEALRAIVDSGHAVGTDEDDAAREALALVDGDV